MMDGGNIFDKYGTKNPVARFLTSRFLRSFDCLYGIAAPADAIEIGCGEGFLSLRMAEKNTRVRGFDISDEVIEIAASNKVKSGLQNVEFAQGDIYSIEWGSLSTEIVVCCEVLEHLPDPESAIEAINRIKTEHFLFSVPNEPVWRILNVLRGAYLSQWGNTPGHIQHWRPVQFISMLQNHFKVKEVRKPFPWTMALCSRIPDRDK